MKLLSIIEAILGTAEGLLPIFIHDPKSQQITGVIVTTVNGALGGLAALQPSVATPPPA